MRTVDLKGGLDISQVSGPAPTLLKWGLTDALPAPQQLRSHCVVVVCDMQCQPAPHPRRPALPHAFPADADATAADVLHGPPEARGRQVHREARHGERQGLLSSSSSSLRGWEIAA